MLPGARKDPQLVTRDWQKIEEQIDGIVVREVLHVPRDHGVITEMFRSEWDPTGLPIVHIYQSRLFPGAIGAWSCHAKTVDRLFVNQGHVKAVLFDGREGAGRINASSSCTSVMRARPSSFSPPASGTDFRTSAPPTRWSSTIRRTPTTTRIPITTAFHSTRRRSHTPGR